MRQGQGETNAIEHGEGRRDPRRAVQIVGHYRARAHMSGARDIWIKDISETGCRFFDKFSTLAEGGGIIFRIGNVGPISAQVRWRDQYVVGIQFDRPLHPSVFDHIVKTMNLDSADPLDY